MPGSYLKISYSDGRPIAAYLHLAGKTGETSARSRRVSRHFVVDYNDKNEPIGVEILSFNELDLRELRKLLGEIGQNAVTEKELAPLAAA